MSVAIVRVNFHKLSFTHLEGFLILNFTSVIFGDRYKAFSKYQ